MFAVTGQARGFPRAALENSARRAPSRFNGQRDTAVTSSGNPTTEDL
jgi:hypothetical protein